MTEQIKVNSQPSSVSLRASIKLGSFRLFDHMSARHSYKAVTDALKRLIENVAVRVL